MSRILTAFDSEVYPNFTLFQFKRFDTGEILSFEQYTDPVSGKPLATLDIPKLKQTILGSTIVTFNGIGYDLPIVLYTAIKKATPAEVYKANERIIVDNMKWWNFEREFGVKINDPKIDHIDLMAVAPLKGSLKVYAGRMHSKWMQDLPIKPGSTIKPEDLDMLREYCANDLENTINLYKTLKVQIELRAEMSKTYGIDLRSKSDAQIAEAVIKAEIEKITKTKLERPADTGAFFKYRVPKWMQRKVDSDLPTLRDLITRIREADFQLDNNGRVIPPPQVKDKDIVMRNGIYRIGIGGLHSSEKCQIRKENEHYKILDFDVASYYPSILLNEGLYPPHIGPNFLEVYRTIVEQRLAAKKAKLKTVAESLKIVANSSFGKLGNKWSVLFAPDLMVQVTVTGQLAILMLVEMLWQIEGCEVISANTDGTTVYVRKDALVDVEDAVDTWEFLTNYTLERKHYEAIYTRDVNNYFAVYTDEDINENFKGSIKSKGVYGTGLPLQKNHVNRICSTALINHITLDCSIERTIELCRDIREFTVMRSVKGGATYQGKDVGKVVRWYYAKDVDEALLYKLNGNLVPTSYGAKPLMKIDDYFTLPEDLDYQWYINNTYKMLRKLEGTDDTEDDV